MLVSLSKISGINGGITLYVSVLMFETVCTTSSPCFAATWRCQLNFNLDLYCQCVQLNDVIVVLGAECGSFLVGFLTELHFSQRKV